MAFFMDLTSLLDAFAVKIRVYPAADEDIGGWVKGQWQQAPNGEPFTLEEPFVPNSRVGWESVVAMLRDTGQANKFAAVWFSKGVYPIKTVVEHNDKRYTVEQIKDLTDYSNVTIYYLEAEDNRQGGVSVGAAN